MKHKRKAGQFADDSKQSTEQIQADHEAFLQVFEKPTQIYRFLRTRHLYHPCFMHRNLSYMKGRCLRKRNTRANFNVESLVEASNSRQTETVSCGGLSLSFEAISDPTSGKWSTADLEVFLLKDSNLRRKANGAHNTPKEQTETLVGKLQLPVNPASTDASSPVSISVDATQLMTGHSVGSVKLKVRACCTAKVNQDAQADSPTLPAKRRRGSRVPEDPAVTHSPIPSLAQEPSAATGAEYGTEITVVDRKGTRQMTDGKYTLVLTDLRKQQTAASVSGRGSWQTVNPAHAPKSIDQGAMFHECPTLKFRVSWQTNVKNGIELKEPNSTLTSPVAANSNNNTAASSTTYQNGTSSSSTSSSSISSKATPSSPVRRQRVFYQFVYSSNNNNGNGGSNGNNNNNGGNGSSGAATTRQQTEARADLTCPWCLLACPRLYSLLKHLRTCHPRFNFTYLEHPKGARIDVSINDHYDGSYSGNPHDLYSYMGFAFCRQNPVKRMTVTQIVTLRSPKPTFELSEFSEVECEEIVRPMVDGHDRLYFHTITCTIQYPSEIDYDSDSELHPMWIRQKTQNLIDDFTDVNEGEKEIMKMWNLHIMHHNFIGDCQLPRVCALFIQEYGRQVLAKNLSRNFLLHLVNLYDHGLIKPELVHKVMMQLYRLAYKLKQMERGSREGSELRAAPVVQE